jgi:hypothetical protein
MKALRAVNAAHESMLCLCDVPEACKPIPGSCNTSLTNEIAGPSGR